MIRSIGTLLAGIFFCVTIPLGAVAQIASAPDTSKAPPLDKILYWGTGGLGLVGPGFGLLTKGTYAWGSSSISAKLERGAKSNLLGGTINEILGASLFYGWQSVNRNTLFRIAAGPAYFKRTQGMSDWFTQTDSTGSSSHFGAEMEVEAMGKFSTVGISFIAGVMAAKDILYPIFTFNLSFGKLTYEEQ
jgi:hypothetical protein